MSYAYTQRPPEGAHGPLHFVLEEGVPMPRRWRLSIRHRSDIRLRRDAVQ